MKDLAKIIDDLIRERFKATPIIKASVVSPPPNLTIDVMGQVIPSEQIYCSNYLLPHYHRAYTIDGVIDDIKINMSSYETTGTGNTTSTAPAGPGPHTHAIPNLNGQGKFIGEGTYKSHKDLWLEDTLKTGDEILVLLMGVFYVVVTKITKMPSEAIEGV